MKKPIENMLDLPVITFCSTACALLLAGCAGNSTPGAEAVTDGSFDSVKTVLERQCVHCHGSARLAGMPALSNTRELATLIGTDRWIIPGSPERSRFYQVATLSDNDPGAMPPTGHAISPNDLATLRAWIEEGAPLPAQETTLTPRGTPPRSR
jgi:mono/diheme cytochrome c family protein